MTVLIYAFSDYPDAAFLRHAIGKFSLNAASYVLTTHDDNVFRRDTSIPRSLVLVRDLTVLEVEAMAAEAVSRVKWIGGGQ